MVGGSVLSGGPSTIRGVATRPPVSSAWATATVDAWEGSGQRTCPMQGETCRVPGRVLEGRIKESSTGSPGAPVGQPVVRVASSSVQRASFGEDRCRTRSRDGSGQRGTQSSDPSRSPSRVAARRAATHPCSGCWLPRNGNETRHCLHQLASGKRCHEPSGSPWHPTSDSRFVRACRFVLVDGRSSCGASRPSRWGPGPHPEARP